MHLCSRWNRACTCVVKYCQPCDAKENRAELCQDAGCRMLMSEAGVLLRWEDVEDSADDMLLTYNYKTNDN